MARVIAFSLDLLAFELEAMSWVYLTWFPLFGVCALVFRPAEYHLIVGCFVLSPLVALFMRWLSRGLYGRKLGRIILVACLSGLAVVLSIAAATFSTTISPWAVTGQAIMEAAALVITIAAIAVHKALLERV
jgi:hypothetical protein